MRLKNIDRCPSRNKLNRGGVSYTMDLRGVINK